VTERAPKTVESAVCRCRGRNRCFDWWTRTV